MPFVVFRGVSQRPGHPCLFDQRTQHDFFMGIDPALAGSVILTTVTDVVGFFAFLGLATVLLL